MPTQYYFAGLAALFLIWNTVTTIRIYHALRRRGVPISFLWLRFMILKYVDRYKKITQSDTGRVGPLYYHWILSINLVAGAAILAVLTAFA
jgi:hypothetical protein